MDLGQGRTGRKAPGRLIVGALLLYGCWAAVPPPGGGDGSAVAGWWPLGGGTRPSMRLAQDHPDDENGFPPGPPVQEYGPEDIEAAHRGVSEGLLGTAEWIDSFFVDERVIEEENRTRFRVGVSGAFRTNGDTEFDSDFDLRLRLPQTEDKLRVLILGSSDDDEPRETRTRPRGTEFTRRTGSGLAGALQYFFSATERRSISVTSGLRISRFEPQVFAGPRYRETIDLDSWTFRFTQALRWYSDDGWESRTILDFERPLWGDLFLRITPDGTWSEDEDGYFYGLNFSVFQPLSERRAVEYQWNNDFETRPDNHLELTALRVRYRQRIWRDWLIVEVAPELRFPHDEDYEPVPGIVLGFDVIFGNFAVDRDGPG